MKIILNWCVTVNRRLRLVDNNKMNSINLINPVINSGTDCLSLHQEICKADLSNVTFLVPLRIDSPERMENIQTLINFTFRYSKTFFIVLEADKECRFFTENNFKGFSCRFIKDPDSVFHRTKWINKLISLAETPYVGIWDADAISPPEQIIRSVETLRSGEAVMSFPYDGRFYACDKISCEVFKKTLDFKALSERIPVMLLMHGYHSVGGAFLVDKEKYLKAGGENEGIYGWGPEDTERVKRMEILNLKVHYTSGTLFHLWHPAGKNSWFANPETERLNRKKLQETCKLFTKSEIR